MADSTRAAGREASIDEVFRTEWPRLVATLVRDLRDLELAEDAAQEAFAEAALRWASDGVPTRPGAWLLTTARRRAIDRIRRSQNGEAKMALVEASARSVGSGSVATTLVDDQLALLLGCCHPSLAIEAQTALTLRVVAGLRTAEIARAFLVPEATMGRRLSRAKHKIRTANIPFHPPDRETLRERLPSVLHVIYLIFTQGHASTDATSFIRGDLCDEALWLSDLVVQLVPDRPDGYELGALLRLIDARRSSRLDQGGAIVLLADQDRSTWDEAQTARGLELLRQAHRKGPIGPYGLQAAINAVHAAAPTFEDTDWAAIVEIYDRLLCGSSNPVIRLNRAVAVAWRDGPEAGLAILEELDREGELADYHYLYAAQADLWRRLGNEDKAGDAYAQALDLCTNAAEQALLRQRLTEAAVPADGATSPRDG